MTDPVAALAALRRPRLLIRAARFGLTDCDRSRDLRRLIRADAPPSPECALGRLIDEEAAIETVRRAKAAGYSVSRHVELLIAIMGEARLLPRREGVL
jgi:hypothetical protein